MFDSKRQIVTSWEMFNPMSHKRNFKFPKMVNAAYHGVSRGLTGSWSTATDENIYTPI